MTVIILSKQKTSPNNLLTECADFNSSSKQPVVLITKIIINFAIDFCGPRLYSYHHSLLSADIQGTRLLLMNIVKLYSFSGSGGEYALKTNKQESVISKCNLP